MLRHGLDLGDAVFVDGGAGLQVQVLAVEFGQRLGLLPVPVGGVGLADLGGVALQRRDPAGQAVLRELRGSRLAVEHHGGQRARPGLGQLGALGAEPGLLVQSEGDVPFLFGQGGAYGGLIHQVGAVDLRTGNGVDGVLRAPQQRPGPDVEIGGGQVAAVVGTRSDLGRGPTIELPETDNPDAEDHGGDDRDDLG